MDYLVKQFIKSIKEKLKLNEVNDVVIRKISKSLKMHFEYGYPISMNDIENVKLTVEENSYNEKNVFIYLGTCDFQYDLDGKLIGSGRSL
mgnify:CR=1 FL=1